MAYETEINKALRSLKSQRISVSNPIVGNEGHVFDVMGFMLTASQIVELHRENKLNERGIREFAAKYEADRKKGTP